MAVYAAYDKMKQGGQAKLIWGPLRHGAGHNIAFYVTTIPAPSSNTRQRKRSFLTTPLMFRVRGQ